MLSKGARLSERDLYKQPLNQSEIKGLIGGGEVTNFLSTKSPLYKEIKAGAKPPSKAEVIKMMAGDPSLIRRPITVKGKRVVVGYDEVKLSDLLR